MATSKAVIAMMAAAAIAAAHGAGAAGSPPAAEQPAAAAGAFQPVPLLQGSQTAVVPPGEFVRSMRTYLGFMQTCDAIPGHRTCTIDRIEKTPDGHVMYWEYAQTSSGPALLATLPAATDHEYGLKVSYAPTPSRAQDDLLAHGEIDEVATAGKLRVEAAQLVACAANCVYAVPAPPRSPLAAALLRNGRLRFDFRAQDAAETATTPLAGFLEAYSDIQSMPDASTVTSTKGFGGTQGCAGNADAGSK